MLRALQFEPPPQRPARLEQSPEALRQECLERAQTYRLLGGVFAEEPSAQFLAALRAPEALEALGEAGLRFDADFTAPELDQLADTLATEYTTLFVASGGFPPVESVRLTGRYYQEPNFSVKAAYRDAGFEVQPDRFYVFEDQLGVELMFVAVLLERAAGALASANMPAYLRAERDSKRFWALHLGRWVRGYASLVQRATEHSFYRETAKLLETFAGEEIEHMRLRVDDVDGGRDVVPKSEVQVLFNPDEPVCNACPGARTAA
jgi:TorA maturation chaperone TorD